MRIRIRIFGRYLDRNLLSFTLFISIFNFNAQEYNILGKCGEFFKKNSTEPYLAFMNSHVQWLIQIVQHHISTLMLCGKIPSSITWLSVWCFPSSLELNFVYFLWSSDWQLKISESSMFVYN